MGGKRSRCATSPQRSAPPSAPASKKTKSKVCKRWSLAFFGRRGVAHEGGEALAAAVLGLGTPGLARPYLDFPAFRALQAKQGAERAAREQCHAPSLVVPACGRTRGDSPRGRVREDARERRSAASRR